MKKAVAVILMLVFALPAHAGPGSPARGGSALGGFFKGIGRELKATAVDFVTWRHPLWNIAVLMKIGSTLADAKTTGDRTRSCATCTDITPWLYGKRPNMKRVVLTDLPFDLFLITGSHWLATHRPEPYFATARFWWPAPLAIPTVFQARAAKANSDMLARLKK